MVWFRQLAIAAILAITTIAFCGPVVLPVEIVGHLIYVKARINGFGPYWLCLDSGASYTIVDTKLAEDLALLQTGSGHGTGAGHGTYKVGWTGSVEFDFGQIAFAARKTALIDLSGPASTGGHPMDGILGHDFLASNIVQVDYERRRLIIYGPKDQLPGDLGEAVPITFKKKLITIPVLVEAPGLGKTKIMAMVDSGSADGLDHDLFGKSKAKKRPVKGGVGLGTPFQVVAGHWDAVSLGNVRLKHVNAATGFNGLLGGEVLHRFTVTFDYPHQKLWLKPNKALSDPFPGVR